MVTLGYSCCMLMFGYGCYLVGWNSRGLKEIKEFKQMLAIRDDYIQKLETHCSEYGKLVDDMNVELKYRAIKIKELSNDE